MSRVEKLNMAVTEEEFLALPESHDHVELIDGEVIVAPSPFPFHQVVTGRLHVAFERWAETHPPAFVGLSPLDVRLAPGRIVQPDLFLMLGGMPPVRRLIEGAPDLVVEVLSNNRAYDRMAKRVIYAEAGVGEYWLVDPDEQAVEVVTGMTLRERSLERVESRVAPGLVLDVPAIFRDLA